MAGKLVWRALTQVTRYLTDDEIRAYAQQQVLDAIGPDTRLVIGHSLGAVVAYEALHHIHHPTALLTLGSPLALRTVVYDRLRPTPSHVPPTVTRWDNLVDRDDLVAAHLDLAPYFPRHRIDRRPGDRTTTRQRNQTPRRSALPHQENRLFETVKLTV
jgi:Alpha/beta hydrolase family